MKTIKFLAAIPLAFLCSISFALMLVVWAVLFIFSCFFKEEVSGEFEGWMV